jgi:hypothetical protein
MSDQHPGQPEEIPLDQIPQSGLDRLFSTVGQDQDPGPLLEVVEPSSIPAPSFGTLADPGAETPEVESVWQRTEVEGTAPTPAPVEPQVPAPAPVEPQIPEPLFDQPETPPAPDLSSEAQERLERLRQAPTVSPESMARQAGIDLSPAPTNPLSRAWGKVRGNPLASAPVEMDPPSEFARLLTPLSGAEVALLEKEVQADETVFVRMERVRADASLRQRLGLLIGILIVLVFLLSAGESYLLEVLPNAELPQWIPDSELARQIAGGSIFALGLIIPFLAVFIFAEAARLILWAIGDRSPWLGAAGALSALAGILVMNYTVRGEIPAAVLLLLVYLVLSEAERRFRPERGS